MLKWYDQLTIGISIFTFFVFFTYFLFYLENKKRIFRKPELGSNLPKVSILVPAYNEEKNIASTLKSLLRLDYPKDKLEIIAINDGSTDRTLEIMKRFRKYGVKIINKPNGGKASALNVGLKKAKGEIIVCMDADSVVCKSALKNAIGYFSDPKVGAVASSLKVYKPKTFWQKLQFIEYLYHVFLRKILSIMDSLTVVPGPFGLYRKSVLLEVGGWDENNLTEDMELTFRIHKAGYKIETSLDSIVYTKTPETLKRLIRQRIRWYRGFIMTAKKHKDLFFNSSYGNLGIYTLPVYITFIVLGFLSVFTILYTTIQSLISTLLIYSKAGFDLIDIEISRIDSPILYANVTNIFWLANILLYSYIFYLSMIMSKSKKGLRNLILYVLQIVIFPFLLVYSWGISIIKEIFRARAKWER